MCSKNYNISVFIHGMERDFLLESCGGCANDVGYFRRSDLADDVSKMISRRESVSGRPR